MKYIHFFFCLLLGMAVQAQIKIGDNPQNIDPSSVLELESSSRVLVITRVNTAQMNAITPSAGAMVYNTDIECIHYYTGAEWKDICDAVAGSITFTSDDGTVVITSTGGNNYDLKVGEITGMNIVNETVFGADIATATIGERQLAPNSVGTSELQDNTVGKTEIQEAAVGTLEIIDGSIKPEDVEPGAFDQLLTTDAGGNVVWLNKNELGATQADQTTITGAGTATDPIKVADTVIGDILANANSITVNANNIAQNSTNIATNVATLLTKEDLSNKSDDTALGNSTTLYPTQNAVKTYVDLVSGAASTLNDGNIFVGNAANVATGVAMGGDATIDNTGAVTIADLAISSPKIALNAVGEPQLANNSVTSGIIRDGEVRTGDILNGNVTDAKLDKANIPLSGFGPAAADVSLGNNRIINLDDPQDPQDAATMAYVDAQIGGSAQTIVSTDTPTNSITAGTDGGAYYVDGDDDSNNEIELPTGGNAGQVLSTNGAGVYTWVDDDGGTDTDEQQLTLEAGNLLTLEDGGTPINLTPFLDNTDNQQLTLEAGNLLTLDNGGTPINLTAFLDNTDSQNAAAVPVTATPTNYTAGTANVEAHLAGIDVAIGAIVGNQDLASVLGNDNSAGNLQISDLMDPTLDQDAATKKYVDDNIVAAGGGVPTDELITAFGLNTTTLTITEDGVDWPVDLDAVFATDAELSSNIALKEDTANKSTDVNLADATNTLFPTELAVKTYVDTQIATVSDDDITAVSFDGTDLTVTEGATSFSADISALDDSSAIATVQADVDANETAANNAIALKEDTANKSTDVNLADATNTLFPTELAVKTYVDTQIATVSDDDITAVSFDGTDLTVTEGATSFSADISALDDSAAIATVQADVDANETAANNAIALKEDTANKSTDVNLADATNTLFPTELAVKTYVDTQIAGAAADDDITAVTFDGTDLTVTEGATSFSADISALDNSAAIATVQADVDANETAANNAIALKEDTANKSTDVNLADATNTLFPTELAVKTYVDTQIATVSDDDITAVSFDGTDLTVTEGATSFSADISALDNSAAIATVQADVDANETAANNAIALKEDTANKSTDVNLADATNTLFPTELAVKTYVDTQLGAISAPTIVSGDTGNLISASGTDGGALLLSGTVPNIFTTNGSLSGPRTLNLDGNNLVLSGSGNVGIGIAPTVKLHVDGDILATGTITPDYVFEKYFQGKSILNSNYEMLSLSEIEEYTRTNNHLPGVPSAKEVEQKGGILVNRATEINLEKIEELFLHTIEQEKKIEQLTSENQSLSAELQSLRKDMDEIKALLKNKN
ncbi:hypothetical protein QSE00_02790 [Arenibacter sp. M-2]|uniref:hypothetical protein n=1 Tax=Arenibacter sp. M-2 TaxID=3053612 RepID=UPI002570616F|nr:hypothetical protein [Arenibacter sp. M-2]MDL5510727.1 hypothetical protein [Arenibacter sp. M-2]